MSILSSLRLLFPAFILLSCARFEAAPPNNEEVSSLLNALKKDANFDQKNGQKFNYLYLKSLRQIKELKYKDACVTLDELLEYKRFPLRTLILANSFEYCHSMKHAQELDNIKLDEKSWNYQSLLRGLYYYYKQNNKVAEVIKFGVLYLPYIKSHKEQTKEYQYLSLIVSQEQLTKFNNELFQRFIEKPKSEQYFMVAKSFEKVRNYKSSRKYYKKIIANKKEPFENRLKAMERHALSYKLERDKKAYAVDLNKQAQYTYALLKKDSQNNEIRDAYFELKINYARGLWTVEETTKAKSILNKLKKVSTKNHDHYARINWLLALMEVEKRKYTSASNYFLKASKYDIYDEDLLGYVYWDTLWNYYLRRNYKQVLLYSQNILPKIQSEYLKDKIQFWSAKSLKALGKVSEANEIFKELTINRPYTYYGIVSYKELGELVPPLSYSSKLETEELSETLSWLIGLNLKDEKKRYINNYLKEKEFSVEEKIKFYHLSESYANSFRLFFKQDQRTRLEIFTKYPQLIFPTPLNEILNEKPEMFNNVENELILSITRQESSFDPMARSWADAFGLMQLLPQKSKLLAKQYKIPYTDFFDLYNSETNVYIGLALLKELKKTFNNKFINFVAAYNAGGNPVRVWNKIRFTDIPLRDIEMIPYKETRGYVKLVLRNFVIYKRLNSKEPFVFPELN